MIQLIIEGKELTNISQHALKWYLDNFLDGKEGPFAVQTWKGECHAIMQTIKLTEQMEMF